MSSLSSQLVIGLAVGAFALAVACSGGNVDTCDSGFTECRGGGTLACCKTECDPAGGCKAKASSGSVGASSGRPDYTVTDPECEGETDFTKRKFCDGVCMDLGSDNQNCGTCGTICGRDTNGIQKTCFAGKCDR